MPTYIFSCESCKIVFEGFIPFSEELPDRCPDCSGRSPIWHQNYSAPFGFVKGNVNTFQSQSDKNFKRMGAYGLDEMKEQAQKEKEKKKEILAQKLPKGATYIDRDKEGGTPWWREEGSRPLDTTKFRSKQQVEKFIKTGETP